MVIGATLKISEKLDIKDMSLILFDVQQRFKYTCAISSVWAVYRLRITYRLKSSKRLVQILLIGGDISYKDTSNHLSYKTTQKYP